MDMHLCWHAKWNAISIAALNSSYCIAICSETMVSLGSYTTHSVNKFFEILAYDIIYNNYNVHMYAWLCVFTSLLSVNVLFQ